MEHSLLNCHLSKICQSWVTHIIKLKKKFLNLERKLYSNPNYRELYCKFMQDSEKAYGSCAYIKSSDVDGNSTVHLLIAKSKVAPLETVTLPRLELCGAVVGARLGQKVKQALKLENVKLVFWTDSTIVLGWLNSAPRNLKTFQLKQHVWSRWSKEYVSELQQRHKWSSSQGCLAVGDMVLVKDDNLPPMNWRLGRVVSVYSGSDSVKRVANIQTRNGLIKRSFAKLCPLPMNNMIIIKRQYLERKNSTEDVGLFFWKVTGKELEPMADVSKKYFCIPGSSVESERTFSSSANLISDRRARLKPKQKKGYVPKKKK
nr:unnamed protein product [Callosobruchus analis]